MVVPDGKDGAAVEAAADTREAIFFKQRRLVDGDGCGVVVLDELDGPSLIIIGCVVWVEMERAKVNVLQTNLGVVVLSCLAIVLVGSVGCGSAVEVSLGAE